MKGRKYDGRIGLTVFRRLTLQIVRVLTTGLVHESIILGRVHESICMLAALLIEICILTGRGTCSCERVLHSAIFNISAIFVLRSARIVRTGKL